jgi:PPOX class probable F420-dependent enzyme
VHRPGCVRWSGGTTGGGLPVGAHGGHATVTFVTLADEKYVLLTTTRRNGVPVSTPVWVVPLDDHKLGFWTSSESGKAKRLAHTDRVTVQPCDARGRVKAGTTAVAGTAKVVTGSELEDIRRRVVAKYGFMTKVTKLLGTLGGMVKRKRIPYGDRGVVIALAE